MTSGNNYGQRPSWPPAGPGPAAPSRPAPNQTGRPGAQAPAQGGQADAHHQRNDWPAEAYQTGQRASPSSQADHLSDPPLQSPWPSRGQTADPSRGQAADRQAYGSQYQQAPSYRDLAAEQPSRPAFGQRGFAASEYQDQADYAAAPHSPQTPQRGFDQPRQHGGIVSGTAHGDLSAPQFEPYRAQRSAAPQQPAHETAPDYREQTYRAPAPQQRRNEARAQQWADPSAANAGSFDVGSYGAPDPGADAYGYAERSRPDATSYDQGYATEHAEQWSQHPQSAGLEADAAAYGHAAYADADTGYAAHDHHAGTQGGHDEMGFAQAAGGELDAAYNEDDYEDYVDEPPRRRSVFTVAAALVGAIVVGGGMAYGYKTIIGSSGSDAPPLVKSASAPSKVKPLDAGGKKFAHADSKIMGRLGDGTGAASASAENSVDANGTRKVSTLVVGRDGSIQAPSSAMADSSVSVPGMTVVDAFGSQRPSAPSAEAEKPITTAAVTAPATAAAPRVVNSPTPPRDTGSVEAAAPSRPTPAPTRIAAAAPAARAAAPEPSRSTSSGTINGYVAVLASVPRSGSSRMEALKRYADLQQKYGSVLSGKTPDVAEANLGAKGNYHRLVVGPPASRSQASSLCSDLKSQGYSDCWVTSY